MTSSDPLIILIPVYNDWEAVTLLLGQLDRALAAEPVPVRVLLVDDGSTQPAAFAGLSLERLARVDVLALRGNLGHQRAIAIGLAHIARDLPCSAVAIMDGDGEDDPRELPRLLARLRETGDRIVFADRTRRMESWQFRAGYRLYCALHRVTTGISVRVGNFSVVPASLLSRLVILSDLWNHYAAAVFQSAIPYERVPTARATRLHGRSRMNFIGLARHGLSAMSVHMELIGVRLLIASGVLVAIGLLAIGAGAAWAWTQGALSLPLVLALAALLASSLLNGLGLVWLFVSSTLHARRGVGFLPERDFAHFVGPISTVFTRLGEAAPPSRARGTAGA